MAGELGPHGAVAGRDHVPAGHGALDTLGWCAARGEGAEHRVVGAQPRPERCAAPDKGEGSAVWQRAN
ncbi:hypothetical protein NDU88_000414 [Pleurodeles waltl]|uniref:Uncharacterized protein n=1 Tax=Pleurodeles waltl TaxID=8319 RepID=A0AAV7S838_PLEWA|nr:hypothetical protein NDU88_000414 [Pleurodeles waltl]